jgi:hypothetical protein
LWLDRAATDRHPGFPRHCGHLQVDVAIVVEESPDMPRLLCWPLQLLFGVVELQTNQVEHMAKRIGGRKYSRKASLKVARAMRERKRGTLRSGRSGKRVTSRKQAIAIGLSEARRGGAKVPRKRDGKKR